jgi:hypothetical protein
MPASRSPRVPAYQGGGLGGHADGMRLVPSDSRADPFGEKTEFLGP